LGVALIIRKLRFNEWIKPLQLSSQLFIYMPLWKKILLSLKLPISLLVMKLYHGETILVAVEESEIIGIVIAKVEGKLAYIEGTVVDKNHRRKGVSKALKIAIHEKLIELGAEKAITQIEKGNEAALQMAYSQGYTQSEDQKYMEKIL
jgi:GNAT superfamily N-acetyltransferase